jgi:acetylornithine deacetylase/succinyl-diaminopimelate desuccinylase-like protein
MPRGDDLRATGRQSVHQPVDPVHARESTALDHDVGVTPAIDQRALRDEATALLRELLRVDTSNPPGGETAAALVLQRHLGAAGVACELVARDPARANLVARIPGTGGGPSLAFLAHTDVVPADDAAAWTHPPFGGHVDDDGYIWGRGAADMKNELATRTVAMAWLGRSGFRPRGDLLLIAEADEEDGQDVVGLPWLVGERPDVRADYVLNEGASERLELADGRVAVTINVGEKSALCATVTARAAGGASSLPRPGANAVTVLARLIERLDVHRPQRRLMPQTDAMLTALAGADGGLDERIARAAALHPMLPELVEPLFAMTIAPTRLHGSRALNVMPSEAAVECDCRPVPGVTLDEVEGELRAALGDDLPYALTFSGDPVGGTISPLETPLYEVCRAWVAENDPGAVLVPTLTNGFTDSHYMREAFGSVAYGFWPIRHTPTAVLHGGVHARDERIHIDDLGYATRFHIEAAMAMS